MSNNNLNGQISTIKDILMGEEIQKFNNEISLLKQSSQQETTELSTRINQLSENFDKFQNEVFEKLNILQNQINDSSHSLNERITHSESRSKEELSGLFSELGNRILNK